MILFAVHLAPVLVVTAYAVRLKQLRLKAEGVKKRACRTLAKVSGTGIEQCLEMAFS
jgi:hypothetical protein